MLSSARVHRFRRIIQFVRPLRPPNRPPPKPRLFAANAPRRDVPRYTPRPQLPFLVPSFAGKKGFLAVRRISTETMSNIKFQIQFAVYWSLIFWVLVGAGSISYAVIRQEWLDRLHPSPPEWPLPAKMDWRAGCQQEATEGYGSGEPDWCDMGRAFYRVLQVLEQGWTWFSKKHVQGATDMQVVEDWDESIPGVDREQIKREPLTPTFNMTRIGYDISHKPEHWIRAYYQAAMKVAKASEKTYDFMIDNVQDLGFPKSMIRSESNPYPQPIPATAKQYTNPREEDCVPMWEDPSAYYVRILTTKGLDNTQRINAGVAYAAWLDFAEERELANAMCHWSLDRAILGLPKDANPSRFISTSTGVISPNAPFVTPNLLAVATQLASHYARSDNTSQALAVYLSVLRARRAAPVAPPHEFLPRKQSDYSLSSFESMLGFIASLTSPPEMPPPPPSGDSPFTRRAADGCHEAILMAYVGEILFASGQSRRAEGLSWTRDAVDLAQRGYDDEKLDRESKKVCRECLQSGLENWFQMVGELAKEERESKEPPADRITRPKTWLPSWMFGKEASKSLASVDWAKEEQMVKDRRREFQAHELDRVLSNAIARRSSWFAF